MSEFDFFFSFFGLLLGLSIAEAASGLADALGSRRKVIVGWATPLMGAFVLLDLGSFWMFSWSLRDVIPVGWQSVFGGLIVAVAYYLSASLIFPRQPDDWPVLDDHFREHKRQVLAGIIVANLVVSGLPMIRTPPALDDFWFFFWQLSYWAPLGALFFSRSLRLDRILLWILILGYLVMAIDVLPTSQWGQQTGV